ncbi:alkylated DNA repair protein (DNA oxidative demethylase) [Jannaschia faecimaris]|uniref:Alkylated DNA repair protein (DNA oxidative demethylase) n=1 Tax=Jannaschia faecimaris TaxID=1244108 RepID=A0A1H3JF94_9RHOB|nr:alpha-ketoglutarate-dependent dioxygenase AlkB [Jannaschia faecimaris]SDY38653.1 alkylated DNA repair protein (DNA oxidative demethylase) [Jannaschia faecimaris]
MGVNLTEKWERDVRGVRVIDGFLSTAEQVAIVEDVRAVARMAPFIRPMTPRGRPLSVRMTSAGALGWVTDQKGYRYEVRHPSGEPWPPIPVRVRAVWDAVVPTARPPESCLVNWYGPDAKMGMHVDRDEADPAQPVVSISLGDDALFRIGNPERGGKTESLWLRSGDVLVMEGPARLLHHGVDRIAPGTSTLLDAPGRINLTLRVVT